MKKRILVLLLSFCMALAMLAPMVPPAEAAGGTGPTYDVYQIFTGAFVPSDEWMEQNGLVNMPRGSVSGFQTGSMTAEQFDDWIRKYQSFDGLCDVKWGVNAGLSGSAGNYVESLVSAGTIDPFEIVVGEPVPEIVLDVLDQLGATCGIITTDQVLGELGNMQRMTDSMYSNVAATKTRLFRYQQIAYRVRDFVDWSSTPLLQSLSLSELTSVEVQPGYYMIVNTPGSVGEFDGYTLSMARSTGGTFDVIPKASTVSCASRFADQRSADDRFSLFSAADDVAGGEDNHVRRVIVEMSQPENLALLDGFYASFNVGLPACMTASDIQLFYRYEPIADFSTAVDPYQQLLNEYVECWENAGPNGAPATAVCTVLMSPSEDGKFHVSRPVDASGNELDVSNAGEAMLQTDGSTFSYIGKGWLRDLSASAGDYVGGSGTNGFTVDTLRRVTLTIQDILISPGHQVGTGMAVGNAWNCYGTYYLAFNVDLDMSADGAMLYPGEDLLSKICIEYSNDPNQLLRAVDGWNLVDRPVQAESVSYTYDAGKLDGFNREDDVLSIGRSVVDDNNTLGFGTAGMTVYVGSPSGVPFKNAEFRLDRYSWIPDGSPDQFSYIADIQDLILDPDGSGVYSPIWTGDDVLPENRLYNPFVPSLKRAATGTFVYRTPHTMSDQEAAGRIPVTYRDGVTTMTLTTDSRGMIHLWGLWPGEYRLTQVTPGDTKGLNMIQPVYFSIGGPDYVPEAPVYRDGSGEWAVPEDTFAARHWSRRDGVIAGTIEWDPGDGDDDGAPCQPNSEYLSVHNNYYYLNIPVTAGVVLPTTGGPGVEAYFILGLALISFPAIVLAKRKRGGVSR